MSRHTSTMRAALLPTLGLSAQVRTNACSECAEAVSSSVLPAVSLVAAPGPVLFQAGFLGIEFGLKGRGSRELRVEGPLALLDQFFQTLQAIVDRQRRPHGPRRERDHRRTRARRSGCRSGFQRDAVLAGEAELRGFRLLDGRDRTLAPAGCSRDRSAIRLVGADGQAIHQRIEAQVQSAGVAMIGLSRIWPLVPLTVNDGPATRRTPPRHARTVARCPSARCSELHRVETWTVSTNAESRTGQRGIRICSRDVGPLAPPQPVARAPTPPMTAHGAYTRAIS